MQFNSIHFMLFFPIVLLVYFIIPKKIRYIWLLVASYYFYMSWNAAYAILIAFSTVVTYFSGLLIDYFKSANPSAKRRGEKVTLAACIIANLSILFVFKYLNFAADSVVSLLNNFGVEAVHSGFDIILPVGISFYTFQALGYVIDVYRGTTKAELNILKYSLFVSFFPQLVAGPIERSNKLLSQIKNADKIKLWNYERIVKGAFVMFWGFFLKVIIADRAANIANTVFDAYYSYGAVELILGVIMFAIQIYCDFASYSTIAVGAASIMGFDLMDNFDTPYFALSIKEFWRRWHISLSTWFKDYLYIPLGGNRRGTIRKYINLIIVFLVSGLWHGANWTFVAWGFLHGLFQTIGEVTKPYRKKLLDAFKINTNTKSYKLIQMAITFSLVCLTWVFFRAQSIMDAFEYIKRIFTHFNPWELTSGIIYELGMNRAEVNILLIALAVMFIVDYLKRFKNIRIENIAENQNTFVRPLLIFSLIVAIVIFGAYGGEFNAQEFIYFQF